MGVIPVGQTSNSAVTLTFSSLVTLMDIRVVTEGAEGLDFGRSDAGGTCSLSTTYAAGSSCQINVFFAPKAPGPRKGAILATTADGSMVISYLRGVGTGPSLSFSPGAIYKRFLPFSNGEGITFDSAGNLYATDSGSGVLYKLDVLSSYSHIADGGDGLVSPGAVAIDGAGNIYVADTGSHKIFRIKRDGTISVFLSSSDGLVSPSGLVTDGDGNLYFSDQSNQRIYKSDPYGVISVIAGGGSDSAGDGILATTAQLLSPSRLAMSPTGEVFFTESAAGRIRKIDAAGKIYTVIAGLNSPQGMAIDAAGFLYFAEQGSQLIRRLDASSGLIPLAGGGSDAASDFIPATQALLNSPTALALDSSGNLAIVENGSTLRILSAAAAPLDNTTAVAQTVRVSNTGNNPLSFYSFTPQNVTLDSSAGSSCRTATALASQKDCTLTLSANPINVSGSLTIQDNAFNGNSSPYSSQRIVMGGASAYASLDHLVIAGIGSADAGTKQLFRVQAMDSSGNVLAGYNGFLHFSSSDPLATLPLDGVLNSGSGSFTVTFRTTGIQTLTAQDAMTGKRASLAILVTGNSVSSGSTPVPPQLVVTTPLDNGTADAMHCTPQHSSASGTDANCSLRDAIAYANVLGFGSISFDAMLFPAQPSTPVSILLPSVLEVSGGSSANPITITGPSKDALILSGNHVTELFTVDATGYLGLSSLTMADANGYSALRGNDYYAGAIYVLAGGHLTIDNCLIQNAQASVNGGAIYNNGTLTVSRTTFLNNVAGYNGGTIFNNGTVSLIESSFLNNRANGTPGGGVIFNNGNLSALRSSFIRNASSTYGGAIYSEQQFVVDTSTFAENSASQGGATYSKSGNSVIKQSTIAGNTSSGSGPGIMIFGGSLSLSKNILSDATVGSWIDGGDNLSGPASLSSLGMYGGFTQTRVPLPGSAAICMIDGSSIPAGSLDQRGVARTTSVGGTSCLDAGAVQTHYALSFATQPTDVTENTTMQPSPEILLLENALPVPAATPISLQLVGTGTLAGSTGVPPVLMKSTSPVDGKAVFDNIAIDTPSLSDQVSAKVNITSGIALSATSDPFRVTATTASLTFARPPAASLTAGESANTAADPILILQKDAAGNLIPTAVDSVSLQVSGPSGYNRTYLPANQGNGSIRFDLSSTALQTAGTYSYSLICSSCASGYNSPVVTEVVHEGSPASITAIAGNGQHSQLGQTFAIPLRVKVTDAYNNPLANVPVSFSLATGDATVLLSSSSSVTGADGSAETSGVASGSSGIVTVTASVPGVSQVATFTLNNERITSESLSLEISSRSTQYGEPITLTALLAPSAFGSSSTDGEAVAFYSGDSLLSSALLSGGRAVWSTSSLPVGSYSLTARYVPAGNDKVFSSVSSTLATLSVTPAVAAITLQSSRTAYKYGEAVSVTAQIKTAASSSVGEVSFYDGSNLLGKAPVTASSTTLYIGSLSVGTHLISAVYDGGLNYVQAQSNKVSIDISPVHLEFNSNLSTTSLGSISLSTSNAKGSLKFVVSSDGAIPDKISLSCSGLPAEISCSVAPSIVEGNQLPVEAQLFVSTASSTASSGGGRSVPISLVVVFPGILLLSIRRARLSKAVVFCSLLGLLCCCLLSGCGAYTFRRSGQEGTTPAQPASQVFTGTVTATAPNCQPVSAQFEVTIVK